MQPRLDVSKVAPDVYKAMSALESCVSQSGLESSLLELVKTRASQINNCAFCLDMHTKDARAHGETEQRLYTLSAWHETPFLPRASGQHWHGQRRLRTSRRHMYLMMYTKLLASISRKKNL